MKGTKFWAFIGNPEMFIKRIVVNVHSNKRKAVRIAKGTEAMKQQEEQLAQGKKRKALDEDEDEPAEEQPAQGEKRKARNDKGEKTAQDKKRKVREEEEQETVEEENEVSRPQKRAR